MFNKGVYKIIIPDFLKSENIELSSFIDDIFLYLKKGKKKILGANGIKYHKIDFSTKSQSKRSGLRGITFILTSDGDDFYIFPIFVFKTQDEDVYNGNRLNSLKFANEMEAKLEKITENLDLYEIKEIILD